MSTTDPQRTNWLTLGLCFVATIFEGLDLQSMGVAAPGLVAEYSLQSNQMGLIASASSVGLLIGAMLGGVISDYIGRKQVLVSCVIAFALMSILTPFAWDVNSLLAVRFLTGLGMGGALPMIIAIAAEAVRPQFRAGAVTMMYCATPIGGFIATMVALASGDWRYIFYVGGIAPLLFAPILYRYLSESEVFKQAKAAALAAGDKANPHSVTGTLFGGGRGVPTSMIWIGFLCSVAILYLLLNWLPLLLVGKGFSKDEASAVQLAFNAGGATGALLLGWLITRINARTVFAVTCVAIAGALIGLAMLSHNMVGAIFAGLVVGMFANGFVFLLYGQAGSYYPTVCRGTGVGAAVAMGRVGAILGPVLAGILLSADKSSSEVLLYILPVVVIAAISVQLLFFWPHAEDQAVEPDSSDDFDVDTVERA